MLSRTFSLASVSYVKYISTQLGHASVQITCDRYGHLFPDEHRVAARRLEAALSSGTHPANQDVNAVTGLKSVFLVVGLSSGGIRTAENTR